jgi:hypothetical protein
MTLALVLLIVEVLVPALRRLFRRGVGDGHRRWRRPFAGLGRRPEGD